jgi:endonuclease-3
VSNGPARPQRGLRVSLEVARALLPALAAAVPDARCELDWKTPFELLIATELSAQSTDAMVNKVTPELFRRWPDAAALAAAPLPEVEAVLRPTGFFRQKARNAVETARLLVERHAGEVPRTVEAIAALPGAARKTANVVLLTAFRIPSGLPVDTHVFRVTRRWGWQDEKTPERVEAILMDVVPREDWPNFGHRAVLFGRHHCTARAPDCGACGLRPHCAEGRADA